LTRKNSINKLQIETQNDNLVYFNHFEDRKDHKMSQKQHEQLSENLFKSKFKKKPSGNGNVDSTGMSSLSGVGVDASESPNAAHLDDTFHNLYIINNNSDLFYTKNEQTDRLVASRLLKSSVSGQTLSNKSSLIFENSASNQFNTNEIAQTEKKINQFPLNEIKATSNANKQFICNKMLNRKVELLKPNACASSAKFSKKRTFDDEDDGQDEDGEENEEDENNNESNDPEETNYLKGCLSQVYLNDDDDPANTSGSKRSIPLLLSNLNNQAKKSIKTNLNSVQPKRNIQAKVYNFLERPTGWKCFIYHFTV
jgi:hypothetical protein